MKKVLSYLLFLLLSSASQSDELIHPSQKNVGDKYDIGYPHLPKMNVDINLDGKIDYCRFVGDSPKIFLSCDTGNGLQYGYNSLPGIDLGFDNRKRVFHDVNRDNLPDFCRCVGRDEKIYYACILAEKKGFSKKQYAASNSDKHCTPKVAFVRLRARLRCKNMKAKWECRNITEDKITRNLCGRVDPCSKEFIAPKQ